MQNELTCPQCSQEYRDDNLPRLLTSCGHTFCEKCIDGLITSKEGAFQVICPEDETVIELQTKNRNHFPKNIALIKVIEAKNNSLSFKDESIDVSKITKNEEQQEDDDNTKDLITAIKQVQATKDPNSNSSQGSNGVIDKPEQEPEQVETENEHICLLHQKPLDVVCMIDLEKICAKCAIFGEHRGHDFKPIEEIQQCNTSYYNEILNIFDEKDVIAKRISNEETQNAIMEIMGNKKDKMKKDLSDKYKKLIQTINKAEKQSVRRVDEVINKNEQRVKALLKIDANIMNRYDAWEEKSFQHLQIIEKGTFQEKLGLIHGPQSKDQHVVEDGEVLLAEMEQQESNLVPEVVDILENIGIEFKETIYQHIEGFSKIYENGKEDKLEAVKLNKESTDTSVNNHSKNKDKNFESSPCNQESLLQIEPQEEPKVRMPHFSKNSMKKEEELVIEPQEEEVQLEPFQEVIEAEIQKPIVVKKKEKKVSERMQIDHKMMKEKHETAEKNRQKESAKKQNSFISEKHHQKPSKKKLKSIKVHEKYEKVLDNLYNDSLEALDLTNAELGDHVVTQISEFIRGTKVKTVKFIRNKLTDDALARVIPNLSSIITLNLSQNSFTDVAIDILIKYREALPNLKSVILSQNKIIQRKHKNKLDQLRKLELTVSV